MKISDVCKILEDYAPVSLAEDFDNVGLLVGDKDTPATSVLLSLDVDINVAKEAAALGANLIISHHPVIFEPLRRITSDTPEGRCLLYLMQNGIAVYSAHTNLDSAAGGLNDLLASFLELGDTAPLQYVNDNEGLGRVGFLKGSMTIEALAKRLQDIFSLPRVRFTGDRERVVSRVALCSGGGGSLVRAAIDSGADVYISGDIKYTAARESLAGGMGIIELCHYDSEILSVPLFEKILGDKIKTYASKANISIYNFTQEM